MNDADVPHKNKARHRLHLAASSHELENMLAGCGVDLDELLQRHGIDTASNGVLIVGSIAEQLATPSSDVDLMVLVDTIPQAHHPSAVTVSAKPSLEILEYESGIEINIEIVSRRAMIDGIRAFLNVAPALYDTRARPVLPIIGPVDRQLLHRLLSGWPIRSLDTVERWRDEFLVVMFPPYLALLRFVSVNEFLEDASELQDVDDGSFSLAARESAAEALFCLLALEGVTNQQPKWLAALADRTLQTAHPEAFTRLMPLVFLPRQMTRRQRCDAIDELMWAARYVRALIDKDADLRLAASSIVDRIRYTR